MNKYNESTGKPRLGEGSEAVQETTEIAENVKKTFVEPEISVPVDVLEATTFFQVADSGTTN